MRSLNIVDAEARHVSALLCLFKSLELRHPPTDGQGRFLVFQALMRPARAAVQGEVNNVALYDRVLENTRRPDLLSVYQALRSAWLDRRLPAFRRCAER